VFHDPVLKLVGGFIKRSANCYRLNQTRPLTAEEKSWADHHTAHVITRSFPLKTMTGSLTRPLPKAKDGTS